jgi:hypothetical protein
MRADTLGRPVDQEWVFCEDETLVLAVGAHTLGVDYIDLGPGGTLPANKPIYFVAFVPTAFTSAGAATLQAKLQTDDNTAFSGAIDLKDSGAVAKATLIAGYEIYSVAIDRSLAKRYLRVTGTVGTADGTGGTITSYLTDIKPVNLQSA